MSEIVQTRLTKQTENYHVFDSPDGDETQALVGTYVAAEVIEQLNGTEYIEFHLFNGESSEGLTITLDDSTTSYHIFSSESDAIEATYISRELLEDFEVNSQESLTLIARPSTEKAFNEALEKVTVTEDDRQEEANALLAGYNNEEDTE
jgi:hypothetical protein